MKAPSFWQTYPPTLMAKALSPFSVITQLITKHRLSKSKWKTSVPVICCGNLTVGGTGKTTVALELGKYFQQDYKVAFLTRGYKRKNQSPEPICVDLSRHTVHDVGDEALLLAQLAPTWVASNRAASAKMAIKNGAELLIMDDGFQNPTLYQDMPILIIDGITGFGNHQALPAGPLRESLQHGLQRAKACILIGEDKANTQQYLPKNLPIFHANLKMDDQIKAFKGKSVIAFAGLGRPSKFFQSLEDNDLHLVQKIAFPDHHFYQEKELKELLSLHQYYQVPLVTTPKDYVRLPLSFKQYVIPLGVHLQWQDQMALSKVYALLDSTLVQGVKG